jgi:hypothetical protein
MTSLQLLAHANAADLKRLGITSSADPRARANDAKFDNRPTWDNAGKQFDNRPSWDNWNKK